MATWPPGRVDQDYLIRDDHSCRPAASFRNEAPIVVKRLYRVSGQVSGLPSRHPGQPLPFHSVLLKHTPTVWLPHVLYFWPPGTVSNADGIGARVYLTARTDGESVTTQVQELLGSSSFLSMNSLDMTFGLGEADRAEETVVRWPSGVTQRLEDVKANRVVTVEEPED